MSFDPSLIQPVPAAVYGLTLLVWGILELLIWRDVQIPWLRFATAIWVGIFMIEYVFFNKVLLHKDSSISGVVAGLLTVYVFYRWYKTLEVQRAKTLALVVGGCFAAIVGVAYVVV